MDESDVREFIGDLLAVNLPNVFEYKFSNLQLNRLYAEIPTGPIYIIEIESVDDIGRRFVVWIKDDSQRCLAYVEATFMNDGIPIIIDSAII